ncbi:hypothetical protein [Streptomyces javensis]|uniref:hypothetical protein n=1 Tax=Streptomyces javensis TaxID=114698 RepID=UPI0031F78714
MCARVPGYRLVRVGVAAGGQCAGLEHAVGRLRGTGGGKSPMFKGRYDTMPDQRVDVADYLDAVRMHLATMPRIRGAADTVDGGPERRSSVNERTESRPGW